MADRYFVAPAIAGDHARLAGAEAHHLLHVMRARVGDEVTLFDGGGAEFLARIEKLGRAEVEVAVIERRAVDRELLAEVTLGVALPKGDRRRGLIEKADELGVARVVPLETERSADSEPRAGSAKLQQAVIEASKQCGRNRLMEIADGQTLREYLQRDAERRLFAQLGAPQSIAEMWGRGERPRQIALAIGPEGGFSDAEAELATAAGWSMVGLGQRTLRVETAALALISAVMLQAEQE
jgi:16S rRNA (uracil1498-N3)-methyltransferase